METKIQPSSQKQVLGQPNNSAFMDLVGDRLELPPLTAELDTAERIACSNGSAIRRRGELSLGKGPSINEEALASEDERRTKV